jgi:hypothetical protein
MIKKNYDRFVWQAGDIVFKRGVDKDVQHADVKHADKPLGLQHIAGNSEPKDISKPYEDTNG